MVNPLEKRIAIMGTGAVGGYIGAVLSCEGYKVTLIDMWTKHVDVMKKYGLHVTYKSKHSTTQVNAINLTEAQQISEPFDYVFICVKSQDTEWATRFIHRFISPEGIIISAQNCMNDETISSIIGYDRMLGCVISGITVALWKPGHIIRDNPINDNLTHHVFRVGEFHGRITNRVKNIVDILSHIDSSRVTSNIWGERWSKLTANASSNPMAMTGLTPKEVAQNPQARFIQIQISKESVLVGKALNYQIEPIGGLSANTWARANEKEVYNMLDSNLTLSYGSKDWLSSMAQDVEKKRTTEILHMNGYIVEKGRDVGVPTPVNSAIVEVVNDIDNGQIKPDLSNVNRVLTLAGL